MNFTTSRCRADIMTKDRRYLNILLKHSQLHINAQTHFILSSIIIFFSPVFIFSCCTPQDCPGNSHGESQDILEIKLTDKAMLLEQGYEYTADIFVFNNDRLQRLDSYQRVKCRSGKIPFAASQNGKKIIAAIVTPQSDSYGWSHINSLQALEQETADLRKETHDKILLSGLCTAEAGKDSGCEIALTPLSAEIQIESIRCDFSGKPYQGAKIEEVKAYLINVNASARIFQKNGFTPETLCNQGGFIENDVKQFEDPGIITNEIKGSVGSQTVYPDIVFRCYPNECEEESAGSPFTRLVIEGKINGNTCFYPIDINRGQPSGKGIGRNCRYIYNITIKSSGSSDPDTAVTPADVDITCGIVPWDESDNDEIIF